MKINDKQIIELIKAVDTGAAQTLGFWERIDIN